MRGYRDLADALRQRINDGEFAVGRTLPRIIDLVDEYDLSRQTVRDAIGVLADEGLVVTMGKGGTIVRNRSSVRIPLSRYSRVLRPGGDKGPWETACAEQGLDGRMTVASVERVEAPVGIAALLQVEPGTVLVYRRRLAMIGSNDVVQVQHVWYPASLADEVGISRQEKIIGGVFGALTAAGHAPTTATEHVTARMPTPSEASQLKIGGKVPVMVVERVTKDAAARPIEVLRSAAPADRVQLTYDDLPLTHGRVQ